MYQPVSEGKKHSHLYFPHHAILQPNTVLFLIASFKSLADAQLEANQKAPLKAAPCTHSIYSKLMCHCKFPSLLVHYSPSVVREVWTMFYQGTNLATINCQV